jgi:hypothetical protein
LWPVPSEPPEGLIWTLRMRDPVELVFVTTLPGITGRASVTVDRHACEVILQLRNYGTRDLALGDVAAWDGGEVASGDPPSLRPGEGGPFAIIIPARR